ncbi:MAG: hypothetical protein ABJO09_01025 [Hyphomicrobiales bacterium]
MPISLTDIDLLNDPCGAYEALYPQWVAFKAGGQVVEIEDKNGRRTKWSEANASGFDEVMADLKKRCNQANGKRRRFAVAASSRR